MDKGCTSVTRSLNPFKCNRMFLRYIATHVKDNICISNVIYSGMQGPLTMFYFIGMIRQAE